MKQSKAELPPPIASATPAVGDAKSSHDNGMHDSRNQTEVHDRFDGDTVTAVPTTGRWSGSAVAWWLAGLAFVGFSLCAVFLDKEQFFPFWDYAVYHNLTLLAADAFRTSTIDGLVWLRSSLQQEYNAVFSLPLIPWIVVFGESRSVFILSVFVVYYVPFVLLGAYLARDLGGADRNHALAIGATFIFATTASWSHVVQGYPDIGGTILLLLCVLLYRHWHRVGGWAAPVLIGILGGLAVVFRRHYVYGVAALFTGIAADLALAPRITGEHRRVLLQRFDPRLVLVAPLSSVLVVLLLLPSFAQAVRAGAAGRFLSWQRSVPETLASVIGNVGLVPLILSVVGMSWLTIQRGSLPRSIRVVALASATWIGLWTLHARQWPYHYPHWLPLCVAMGLTALWLALGTARRKWLTHLGKAALAAVVAVSFIAALPLGLMGPPIRLYPHRLLPDRVVAPQINPAYIEITELISYLRGLARPQDSIVIAASSTILNPDILRSAEAEGFGRKQRRLHIVDTPQTDSPGVLPTEALLSATFVLTAVPLQEHLGADRQKVVQVIVDAFEKDWPIAQDFERVRAFELGETGIELFLYRRTRMSSPAVARETAYRIEDFVTGKAVDRLAIVPVTATSWRETHSVIQLYAPLRTGRHGLPGPSRAIGILPPELAMKGGTLHLRVTVPEWVVLDKRGVPYAGADGVVLRIQAAGSKRTLQRVALDMHQNASQRRWHRFDIAVPPGTDAIVLEAEPGLAPTANNAYDQLLIGSREPVKFRSMLDNQ